MHYFDVNNFNLTRKIAEFLIEKKIRENATGLYSLTIDNFNLTRKIRNENVSNLSMAH